MAGGPANILSGAVAPIGLPTPSKPQMKILCLHPKSRWKLRVRPQNPHQNPLFATKTILPIWSRPLQTKTLCPQLLAAGGSNWAFLEWTGKNVIEPVVPNAVEKFADVVVKLALLLFRVFADFERIKKDLKRMQSDLKDAEFKQNTVEGVGKWAVEDLRDVSYEVDDVIDNIGISCKTEERSPAVPVVGHVERFISQLKARISIAWQILIINLKIRDISRMRELYGTIRDINDEERQEAKRPSISSRQEHRQFYSDVNEPEVVRQEDEIKALSDQLTSEEPRRRHVISIVGMAGSGKTTIAKEVYECKDVKKRFKSCRARITVSRHYIIKDVLMSITKGVMRPSSEEMEGLSRLTEKELGVKVRDYLKNKRYLVVIDDIWSKEAWDYMLEPILPDVEKRSSRVMLTTRFKEVASNAIRPSEHPYEMRLLNNEDGWKLFTNKIFGGEVRLPESDETILRKILAKCGGLPLAILALGGLLRSKKKTFKVWSKVLESVNEIIIDRSNECGEILALCYSDLPSYLKPCFLYFGLFPEDYKIDSERLILMWIAEGFIQQKDNEIMEDTAQDYLEELVDRSMIEASSKRSDGSIAKCRIHDCYRELSISEAQKINFFTIHDVEGTCSFSSTTSVRRLVLHRSVNGYCPTVTLRSLLSFHYSGISYSEIRHAKLLRVMKVMSEDIMFSRKMTSIVELIHTKFQKVMKVMSEDIMFSWKMTSIVELIHTKFQKVMKVMSEDIMFSRKMALIVELIHTKFQRVMSKEFVHLRYLELERAEGFLPSSIGDLNNLQTLVVNIPRCPLPAAISNLEQLRHLRAFDCLVGNLQVNKLTNLQTLCLQSGKWIKDDFGNLINLRKLIITNTGNEGINEETLSDSIRKLCNLRSLTLLHLGTGFLPQLKSFTDHSHLYEMSLFGAMKELPELPPNLVNLTLVRTRLEEAAISELGKLSHLRILQLRTDAYKGEKMICSAGSFPRLEILIMHDLPLEEWRIEDNEKDKAMPSLKSVHLIGMFFLQTVPEQVRALLELDTWDLHDT